MRRSQTHKLLTSRNIHQILLESTLWSVIHCPYEKVHFSARLCCLIWGQSVKDQAKKGDNFEQTLNLQLFLNDNTTGNQDGG